MPPLAPARALVWAVLAVLALRPLLTPADPGGLEPVSDAAGCALRPAGEGAAERCPCERWDAELRGVLDLPLPLNRADAAELETLSGVGPVRAAAIVADRERHGPFAHPRELARVRGIGPATAERLAPRLFTGDDPACAWAP